MKQKHQEFIIRDWQKGDRNSAAEVIRTVLEEYGLPWQPELAGYEAFGSILKKLL